MAKPLTDADFEDAPLTDDDFLEEEISPQEKSIGEQIKEGALRSLPGLGGMAGGILGFASPVPGGTIAGGVLGSAGGKYAEESLRRLLDENPSETPHKDALIEGAIGGVTEGVGSGISKGLKFMGDRISKLRGSPKPNAAEILAAGERLGVNPTQGMLTDSPVLQGMESSLSQSPSLAGRAVGRRVEDVQRGLQEGAEKVLRKGSTAGAPTSQYAAGQDIQGILKGEVDLSFKKPKEFYQTYTSEVTPFIETTQKQKNAVARNIRDLDIANAVKGSPEQAFANRIADSVEGVSNIDQLRRIKTYVGNSIEEANRTGNGNLVAVSSEIYGKLARLEQRALNRGSIEALASEAKGTKLAKKMITDLKEANSAYRTAMQDIRQLAKEASLGKARGPEFFTKKVAALPPEKMVDKFFSGSNARQMSQIKEKFPQTFEALQRAKQADIWKKSLGPDDKLSVAKLLTKVRGMTPEARKMIFGDSDTILRDVEILNYAKYPKMGPSGTPQGLEYLSFNPLNPMAYKEEIHRAAQKAIIDNPRIEVLLKKASSKVKPGILQAPRILYEATSGEDE